MPATVLEVLITGDATQLKSAYVQASAATKEFAAATASSSAATQEASATSAAFGKAANKAFTYAKLGALAFAAVSVKAAIDFNREFTLIAAVTNTAADRLDSLKGTVMDLSHETGVAPTELAHSLYFLASAGLSTTQQMQALDATARGSAVGLGTAGDLARITANALNAFSDQGLSATSVMDTLTAAIREGTAEPDEFASALGRVLPIADNAGLSFQQVAASLATMSNAGLDVNEGVTALRAILQSLVAPTAQTTSAFATMGLTVTDVVSSMQGQGLIATLRTLQERAKAVTASTGEYNQLLRHAIPNIRGLAGALNLTGQDAAKVDAIFQAVVNSNGDLAKAFATTAESDAFKLRQAFNDITIAGQQMATAALPEIAASLEWVARNTKLVIAAFVTWATFKTIAPMLRDIAAANEAVAVSEAEVAAAQATAGASGIAAGVGGAAAGIGGGAIASQSMFAQASAARAAAAATAEAGAAAATAGASAANATASFAEMGFAVSGTGGALAGLGNAIGARFLPQIFALIQAAQDADTEFRSFHEGIGATVSSIMNSQTMKTLSSSIGSVTGSVFGGAAGSILQTFFGGADQAKADAQKLSDAFGIVQTGFVTLGYTADQQAQITSAALADIGAASLGDVDASNIDAFVTAVQGEIDKSTQAAAAAKQQAAAELELTKQTQAAHEATDSWQRSTAKMTEHLSGLSRIGINTTDFMSQLENDLANSDDQAKTFGDAIDKVTEAWNAFKQSAQDSLTFAPQMLSDLSSAAQQAQESLANMAPPAKDLHGQDLVDYNNNLADLQSQANLTGEEILQAFQDAAAQTKTFGKDLLEISRVGGAAGKDLAASLLQSGDILSAQVIADSPAKLQRQITHAFGSSETAADTFSTKLTKAIVGPLDDIVTILAKIARQQFGIDLHLNDKDVRKKTKEDKKAIDGLTQKRHFVDMALHDDASAGIKHIQDDTTHLVANAHKLQFQINQDQVTHQLQTMETNLDRLTSRKYTVDVGVHTHGKSPMPDEALKMHLFDPMKQAGFKRVGDAYTLPLEVGAHTDMPSTYPGGDATPGADKARQGKQIAGLFDLKKIEQRQLQVLFDIRKELKSSGGGGGSGGSGGSSSGGTDGRGGHPHGSLHDMMLKTPLQRSVADIFQKVYKAGMTPGEAKGIIARVAREGRDSKFIGGAIKDMAKELGPQAAKEFGHSLRSLDASTARNAKHQRDALDAARDAFKQMTEQSKHMTQHDIKQQQAREEARKQWMADALAYATHNVPRLPRGHTNISVNHHEGRRRREVTLDRKRFTDSAAYEVDYARGF